MKKKKTRTEMVIKKNKKQKNNKIQKIKKREKTKKNIKKSAYDGVLMAIRIPIKSLVLTGGVVIVMDGRLLIAAVIF